MNVKFLALSEHFAHPELSWLLGEQMTRTDFVLGDVVDRFESEFAAFVGCEFAIGVNSGTDALFLALKVLGIGPGDEVITAPNSFIATAGAIVAAGARPVFADVGRDYNLDPERVTEVITNRTRAIVPVHLTGNPADMPALEAVAERHGIALIEDAAQAAQAAIGSRRVGSWGACGCFSLHPLKNLPVAGDGGVVTTQSRELAERLQSLRNHGLKNRNEIEQFGFNSRLDSIQACIGRFGLQRIDAITRARQKHAARYDQLFADLPAVVVPPRRANVKQVFHTYIVQVEQRADLMAFLSKQGIETKIHYPIPIHLQAPCRAMGYAPGDFPVCEAQAERILSLPVNEHLTDEQIDYVADRIRMFYSGV